MNTGNICKASVMSRIQENGVAGDGNPVLIEAGQNFIG